MGTVTYTAGIKCETQVRLTTELPEGYVDNNPIFYRQARETQLDFYDTFTDQHPELLSNGNTPDGFVIEGGMLKSSELNGPCLLMNTLIGGLLSCPSDGLQINNLNSYIFRRANELTAIHGIYPISINTISNIQYFQTQLTNEIYTPNLKNSIIPFSIGQLDALAASGGIAAYIAANSITQEQFFNLCEYTPISFNGSDPFPTIYNLRTNYFPLDISVAVAIVTNAGFSQYVIPAGNLDIFNGIIKIDLTGYSGVSNITGFYIFYGVVPAYYPLIKASHLNAYNSPTMQPVIISNKTSSQFDQISISTNQIVLVKDPDNTATDQVTIINYSSEYLFIETDQDIQINGKTFLANTESILPGQYSVLNIKLARSLYNTSITTITIQIGIYDRYNGVKKYIDSIQVTVS